MSENDSPRSWPDRDPSEDPTPLDRASLYVEALKYGPGPGKLKRATGGQVVGQLEVLLRDADVSSMTGRELLEATEFYARSSSRAYGVSLMLMRSVFLDGLMHGLALGAGLQGEVPNPKAAA